MTNIQKCADERRTHRIATYLSESEHHQLKQQFKQSDFDNFSQYHRELLLRLTHASTTQLQLPAINEDVSKSLTKSVHAFSRFSAQLEMFQLIYEQSSNADIQEKLDNALSEVRRIAELCYIIVGWYRQNNRAEKRIVKDIVSMSLTSDELRELAETVRAAEAAL